MTTKDLFVETAYDVAYVKLEDEYLCKDFRELGIDSLDFVEIGIEIEKKLNIAIPDTFFDDSKTPQEFIEKVETLI